MMKQVMVQFVRNARWLALAAAFAVSACSSGGSSAGPATPQPTVALSAVTVSCGTAAVYGPGALTAGPYGSGSVAVLAAPCPPGSQVTVNFTPAASASTLGSAPVLVFDLLPSASTNATAVAAGDATDFTAGTAVTGLAFTTPTYASSGYLYVYLTQLEPQGD